MEPPILHIPELRSFDPSQPRGADGRWLEGSDTYVRPNLTFDDPPTRPAKPLPIRGRYGPPPSPAAPPRGPAVPPDTARDRLRTTAILKTRPQAQYDPSDPSPPGGVGSNQTERLTLADGSEAIFKPRSGERGEYTVPVRDEHGEIVRRPDGTVFTKRLVPRSNVRPGTYWQREVAGYEVAKAMKLDLVPPTAEREIDGRTGSVQQVVSGRPPEIPADGAPQPLPREAAERLRVFDFVTGNSDRTWANVLVDGDRVHAIDHGLAFPKGAPDRFIQPLPFIATHTGPLTEQTRSWLAGLEPRAVSGAMARAGIEREAAEHALRRMVHLQAHPELLEIRPEAGENSLKAAERMERGAQAAAHAIAASEGVSPAHVYAAYSAMEEAYAGR